MYSLEMVDWHEWLCFCFVSVCLPVEAEHFYVQSEYLLISVSLFKVRYLMNEQFSFWCSHWQKVMLFCSYLAERGQTSCWVWHLVCRKAVLNNCLLIAADQQTFPACLCNFLFSFSKQPASSPQSSSSSDEDENTVFYQSFSGRWRGEASFPSPPLPQLLKVTWSQKGSSLTAFADGLW